MKEVGKHTEKEAFREVYLFSVVLLLTLYIPLQAGEGFPEEEEEEEENARE